MKLYVEEEWQRVPSGGTSLMLPTPDVQLKGGRDERLSAIVDSRRNVLVGEE